MNLSKTLCSNNILSFVLLLLVGLNETISFGSESAGRKYAVEPIDGVPTMTIDGQPVRARIFFGIMGASPIFATEHWKTHEYEFTALDDSYGEGTIHFRFGSTPGVVALDNISIVEKESGRQIAGPYSFENESDFVNNFTAFHSTFNDKEIARVSVQEGAGVNDSNALVVRLNEYPSDWIPDFHIYHIRNLAIRRGVTYIVKFDLRADVSRGIIVNLYRPASPNFIKIGTVGRDVFSEQIKLAAKAGVNFVSFDSMGKIWPNDDGSYDWTKLDASCDAALKANPNAALIPRLHIDATESWLEERPNAKAAWAKAGKDHDGQGWLWAATVSQEYRQTACESLRAAIRHLESKYGDSMAGYHPAGQNTSEWFTPNTWTAGYPGFSNADKGAFRTWLKNKYHSDENLKQAWDAPNVSLDTALVPNADERDVSREKPLVESQKLIDFNEYWQSTITDLLCELARTIKEETGSKKLSVFFYGYSYEFSTVSKGPAASAHYALRNLLNCPDVDIICSPLSYSERQLGGGCSCMLNAESVTAAGKLYVYEDDSRTFLAHAAGATLYSTTNVKDSVSVLLRNSAETALRNFGTWLMDLGSTGWYDSPELWQASASLEKLDRYFLENPTPYAPEVGLFLSERSMLKVSSGKYSRVASTIRRSMNLLGAPYAQYDLDDLLSDRITPPKLCVVLNEFALTPEERELLELKAQKTNSRVLYVGEQDVDTHWLRKEAAEANVHVYTDLWCNVWANGPFVLLHAPADGVYKFRCPMEKQKIYDYFNNELLSQDGVYSFPMKFGETKIFRLE